MTNFKDNLGNLPGRVLAPFQSGQTLDEKNARALYGDIAWFGVLSGIVSSFLSVFIIRLGGTDVHVGLVSAIPALAAIFMSIQASRMVEREKKPLSVLNISAVVNRFGYFLIALVPFVFATNRADAVVGVYALFMMAGGVANIAFTTMFGQAVKPDKRAQVVSIRNVLIGITSTLAAFFGGRLLDQIIFPINYQILFVIGFAASMMSSYYLTRIRLPETVISQVRKTGTPRGAREFIAMLRGARAYSRFAFASFLFHWALFFAVPLYSIFWVRELHASDGWIGVFSMIGSATTIVFYPIWGRIAIRCGNRYVMALAAAGLAMYQLFTAIAPNVEWIMFVSFLGGVFTPGFGLAFFNGLLEVCPEENRASYIAGYSTLVNFAAFISPMIASSLTAVVDLHGLMFIGALLRFAGAVWIWWFVYRPAE